MLILYCSGDVLGLVDYTRLAWIFLESVPCWFCIFFREGKGREETILLTSIQNCKASKSRKKTKQNYSVKTIKWKIFRYFSTMLSWDEVYHLSICITFEACTWALLELIQLQLTFFHNNQVITNKNIAFYDSVTKQCTNSNQSRKQAKITWIEISTRRL